jgi:hypothetical protein
MECQRLSLARGGKSYRQHSGHAISRVLLQGPRTASMSSAFSEPDGPSHASKGTYASYREAVVGARQESRSRASIQTHFCFAIPRLRKPPPHTTQQHLPLA